MSRRVRTPCFRGRVSVRSDIVESRSLGLERKVDGKFHLMLSMGEKPIANKYCEGKMKRTLERELKVPEIADRYVDKVGLPDENLVYEGLSAVNTVREGCVDAVVLQFSPGLTSIG